MPAGDAWARVMARFVPSGTCDCGHSLGQHMHSLGSNGAVTRCVGCRCDAFFPATWLPR